MRTVLKALAIGLVLLLAYPAWIATQVWQQSRDDENRSADAIVILGAAQYNGRPSPVYQARLDHALYLYEQDLAPLLIVTGGKQPGDRFTEAETGENYLAQKGVRRDVVLGEARGRTTLESLTNVKVLADDLGLEKLLLVTDPMHSERVKRMASDLGFEAFVSWASYRDLRRSRATKFRELVRETASIIVYELFDR